MNRFRLRKIPAIPLMVILLAVFCFALDAFSGVDEGTVTDPAFSATSRNPVLFDHEAHMDAAGVTDCNTCHHVFEDGAFVEEDSSEGMTCSECHLGEKGETLPLIKAYHQRCKSCHLEQEAGPVTCAGCHPAP